jgi:type I restriction enzyme S subunit
LPKILHNAGEKAAILEGFMAKIEEARRERADAVKEIDTLVATKLTEMLANGNENLPQKHLGDYVTLDNYGTSEKCNDDRSGVPVLRMGNIQNGKLDYTDLKFFHLSEKEKDRFLLKKDDIIINRTNSAELVGKCAVFDSNNECAFASYLIRFRIDPEKADSHLIANIINSPYGRKYMFDQRKQMTGQANVNAKKLKSLPLSLPSLVEQRRIVAHLDRLQAKVDEVKRLQAETEREMETLGPAVLAKAFGN